MDRALVHTSNALIGKLEEWQKNNLKIFWLPAYSPKLNLDDQLEIE
jgi:hypothetical protein